MSKHTTGPWEVQHEYARHHSINKDGYWIGRCKGAENARLIAAAPDLLDALKALTHSLDWEDMIHDDQKLAFSGALSAITKATGETK